MDKYFLVYPLTDDWQQVSWCAYAPDEELQVKQGSLETLAKVAPDVPMIAVVPGTWLNIFSITLPKGRASQIKKAIPFLLEEQLAEDLENVHIALPAVYQLGEITPIAVINKNRMQVLTDAFKNQNLNLQQAVPNWLCLPLFEQTWTLHLTQELACVRQAKDLGFCIQKSLLMPMLTLALSQTDQKPQSLHVYHLALEAADMEEQLTTLKIPLAYEAVPDEPLLLWAENFTSPAALNLLQGEFFVRPKVSPVKQIWRKSAAVFAAIIVAFVLQSSIEFQHYQKQYEAVHAKTLALYTSVFPNEKQTTNARAQLETVLADTGGGVNNPLFDYLQAISEPLLNSPDVNLQQIALHEKSLQIEVIVKDFAALGQLENELSAKGLTVKQESASLEKDQVLARLRVTQ